MVMRPNGKTELPTQVERAMPVILPPAYEKAPQFRAGLASLAGIAAHKVIGGCSPFAITSNRSAEQAWTVPIFFNLVLSKYSAE